MLAADRRDIFWLALLSILVLSVGAWLGQFPWQPGSDDALFFARGVARFSVLEFSPHWPGYPLLILLARLPAVFLDDPYAAIHLLVLSSTLVLTPLCFLVLRHLQVPATLAGWFALVWLALPLTPLLGLSGLSDAPGLVTLLGLVWAQGARHWRLAGLALGLLLGIRPSYAPLALPLISLVLQRDRPALIAMAQGAAAPLTIALGYLWMRDGWAYVEEGQRFLSGHVELWGNTVLSEQQGSWWLSWVSFCGSTGAALGLATLLASAMLSTLWRGPQRLLAVYATVAWLWMLLMQNPLNLRHLAPSLLLSLLCLACWLATLRFRWQRAAWVPAGLLLMCVWWPLGIPEIQPSPLQQAADWLRQQPGRHPILVNQGVQLLRQELPGLPVVDAYYSARADWLGRLGAWRLSSTPRTDAGELLEVIPPRFPGEPGYWIYWLPTQSGSPSQATPAAIDPQ